MNSCEESSTQNAYDVTEKGEALSIHRVTNEDSAY